MAYHMSIMVSKAFRLSRRVHYFEYSGIQFKLFQRDPRRHADVLLTILPHDDDAMADVAYRTAGEFLSALSWRTSLPIALNGALGSGGRTPELRSAKCRASDFPAIPFANPVHGFGLSVIPHIQTAEQRRALAMYREALSSNKTWLSFLFYWQMMEVAGDKPAAWIDSVHRPGAVVLPGYLQGQLDLEGASLGSYLLESCRHAIAHVRRFPGLRRLEFDVLAENRRMSMSTDIVRIFAEYYVDERLALNQKLHLVRKRGQRVPVYVDRSGLRGALLHGGYVAD
jgi:hypothetical protein